MNLKKILAVVLSMTLLVTCVVSGMSLNTSAAENTAQNEAKAALEQAWNALYYEPEVALQGFYTKLNGKWTADSMVLSNTLENVDGLTDVPFYEFGKRETTSKTYLISGTTQDIDFKTSTYILTPDTKLNIYIYAQSSPIKCQVVDTASNYHNITSTVTTINAETNLYKHTFKITSSHTSLVNRPLGRVAVPEAKMSAVVYEEKAVAPTKETLLDLVKEAEDLDLTTISDGEAKDNFVAALADAVEAIYTDETSIAGYLKYKWGKMNRNSEVVFGNFYDKKSGSWQENTADVSAQVINGEEVKVLDTANKYLIIMAPTNSIGSPTVLINFDDYDEIYLYYKNPTGSEITGIQCAVAQPGQTITDGAISVALPATVGNEFVKFDIKAALVANGNASSLGKYNGTTEGKYWARFHFGLNNASNIDISQIMGIPKTVVTTETTFSAVVKAAMAEDLSIYAENTAKTEFKAVLEKAKTVYYSNEVNAKAAIISAWKKVEGKVEVLFPNFFVKNGSWTQTAGTVTEDGITYLANPIKDYPLIIGGADYRFASDGFIPDDYEDFFVYVETTGAFPYTAKLGYDSTGNNYGIGDTKNAKFNITAATSGMQKVSIKDSSNASHTCKYGRLHFETTNSVITKISQVYGVKKVDFTSEFGEAFITEDATVVDNPKWTLAQWIEAYTKYDFVNDYSADELVATVEAVCAANPKYAAFKDAAGYANKVQNVVAVVAPQYDRSNAGITVTKVVNTSPEGVPTFDLYTVGEFGTTTFTGNGLGVLGTTNHSKGFVRYSGVLSTFNSNTNGLYLSYYIPSDKVPAATPITIQVHYRGTSSTDGDTSGKTAYLKQITLTERDKWAVLDLDDLKVDGLSTLTKLSDILVDVCADTGTAVEMYFSPIAFTNSANAIDTAGATTLTGYAEKYNAIKLDVTDNVRYLYEAQFITARAAFNGTLNPDFRISAEGIFKNANNECFYSTDGGTLATAYRTYAQYICPVEDGKAVLNKVIVDGTTYDLVSRSILIERSADGNFGPLDMTTVGATHYVKSEGDALTNTYWSIEYNEDGTTATVTYSMLLKGVSQTNAESKYHMTRAMIEYTDGRITMQAYSKAYKHGTIKDTYDYAYSNNPELKWFE